MHVLIAPNAFKHSLGAADAAAAIAEGLRASSFAGTTFLCPIGDGGDGTAELLSRHLNGSPVVIDVQDALGRAIESQYCMLDDHTAIIELAAASGLRRLRADELDPLQATSFGTGQMIAAAVLRGAREIVLCVGGSATVDGGCGLMRALGAEFFDADGRILDGRPASLVELESIDTARAAALLDGCGITVLCDVTNPLLGDRGAAAVFGPQKGATASTVRRLEWALGRFADVVARQTGTHIARMKHGGAAGGVAAGLSGLLGARLVEGIDYFLDRIGFERALQTADVVITGEGSLDEQTAAGKGPWGVARRARARGVFVIGLAGCVPLAPNAALRTAFDVLMPIGHAPMPLGEAMACTAVDLTRTSTELGHLLALAERADQRAVTAASRATMEPTR